MKETYLTKEVLKDIQEKLQDLKTVIRREIAESIHTAKEHGDLSENAEYVNAKEEQRRIETKISELEAALKNAHVVTHANKHEVSVGNVVKLNCNGQEIVYRIVGSNEADPMAAKISNESPMGQALMGRKKGEKVLIPTPAGEKDCEVIEIL